MLAAVSPADGPVAMEASHCCQVAVKLSGQSRSEVNNLWEFESHDKRHPVCCHLEVGILCFRRFHLIRLTLILVMQQTVLQTYPSD